MQGSTYGRGVRSIAAAGAIAMVAAMMSTGASAAPAGPIEDLGEPLQDVLLIGGDVGPGPNGETVIWSAVSSQPATLNAVDPADGSVVASYPLEGAGGSWEVEVSPDGSVYVGTYSSSKLFRWTAEDGLVDLGNPLSTATFVWTLDTDESGVVYGGTSPDGAVFSWDPATEEFRDYGRISESDYIRSLAVHDGVIYAGTIPQTWVFAIDAESGESTRLPDPPGLDPSIEETYDVDVVDGYLYVRFGGAFPGPMHVWDIAAGEWVDEIPAAHGLQVPESGSNGEVYLIVDSRLNAYDPTTGVLTPTEMTFTGRVQNTRGIGWAELDDPDFPGESIVGLLWRGLMFRYSPSTGHYDFIEASIPGTPIPVTVLTEGVGERVHAGGFLSGGFATMDRMSGEQTGFQRFAQMEAMVTVDDRTYLGAYPEARFYDFDPARPWHSPEYSPSPNEGDAENPRMLVNLLSESQVRAGALTAAGDLVALGTEPGLDQWGGVLLLWDPATEEVVFQERGLVEDQSIVSLTYHEGVIYGATSINGGYAATVPRAEQSVVFAFSVADRELLWQVAPVEGAGTVNDLTVDSDGLLWGTSGGRVFTLDPATQEVTLIEGVPDRAEFLEFNAHDGLLYVDWGSNGLGWLDPSTQENAIVTEMNPHAHMVDSLGQVWFSQGTHLYRFATEGDDDTVPTPEPSVSPSPDPSESPSPEPSVSPTPRPTGGPSDGPTTGPGKPRPGLPKTGGGSVPGVQ